MTTTPSGFRRKAVKLKTAKRRKISSSRWLQRQLNDPYVARSKIDGYRSRAAYKLLEINDKFKILKPGMKIVDLGAAPGGWSGVATELIKVGENKNSVIVAIDLLEMDPIPGVIFAQKDFYDPDASNFIMDALGGEADMVMSDMASNTIGHQATDHLRIMDLCERAFDFALTILKPGGHFIAKIFRGGTENTLLTKVKANFTEVKHFKPPSSRKESSEFYLIALNRKAVTSDK